MKITFLLSMAAAYAGAVSLRGDGVEEVGEHIERFLPEDYDVHVDRRLHVEEEASELIEDVVDEWLDQDIVGHVAEDDNDVHVEDYLGEDDEEKYNEEFVNRWPEQSTDGEAVEAEEDHDEWHDEEYYNDKTTLITKEYARDPNSVTVMGTDLMGEAVDQNNRRETTCPQSKSMFMIKLSTDLYGFETEWKLININEDNRVIASGPPPNRNYGDERTYMGRWCLSPGQYKFQLIDSGNDGICSDNPLIGCGGLRLFVNNQNAGRMINDKSDFRTKDFPFVIGTSPHTDDVGNSNNSDQNKWCNKVRSVMQVPQGMCTLPDGEQGHHVRVTTKVDRYGRETSWKITSNNVVKMQMEPIIANNQELSIDDCLPAGKYNLEFSDFDGVCCNYGHGFFKLIVDGKQLLDGGDFQDTIDHDFQLGFDWISSMNERDCEWWWAHDHRRRDWHTRCYPGQYCGKTYRHLKFSPALKASAQVYATKLLDSCADNGIKHDPVTEQGENLAKNRGPGGWGSQYPSELITKRFVDNEEFWGWKANNHLTQAIWYPTRYIGCAESVKSMGGNKVCRMQVCRYAKAGNCNMAYHNSYEGNNWMKPMMMDDSGCGPMCASSDGCYH